MATLVEITMIAHLAVDWPSNLLEGIKIAGRALLFSRLEALPVYQWIGGVYFPRKGGRME